MPRAAPILLVALLAACTSEATESCPADAVGTFAFVGELKAGAELAPGFDPGPALTDCDAAQLGFPIVQDGADLSFRATLAGDGAGPGGALCRPGAPILFGTRAGMRWQVEETTDGAVLGGCGATCSARSRVVVTGDLLVPPEATPGADPGFTTSTEIAAPLFRGALVEQLTATGGDCGGCALPCAARYELAGTPEPP